MIKTVFITARTGSSRLPNKAILKINNKHTIEYVIDRVKFSSADLIVLCTTNLKEDNILCEIAEKNNIHYFQGNENDKLIRWRDAANFFGINFFVTADGDDLFYESSFIDLAFNQYKETNADFIQGEPNFVIGSFGFGIKVSALIDVCNIKNTDDTEMMWVYFTDTGLFKVEFLQNVPEMLKNHNIRMTLDYQEDFDFFKAVINKIGIKNFSLYDIISLCYRDANIPKINWFRNQEWKENQIKKTNLILK